MEAPTKSARIDIGRIRRDQIVRAAVAVISEQGIQNLSLSEIEGKVGMSRGQLTYYFRTKEDILLAVFDRLVEMMNQRAGQARGGQGEFASWQEAVRYVLDVILQQPPMHPEFGPLQYTFLSQIGHRADFRQRLAQLYEEWRTRMASLLAQRVPADCPHSPRTLASLIQAIFHGLAIQNAADPAAIDREQIVELCLNVLGGYVERDRVPPWRAEPRERPDSRNRANGRKNGVKHE